MKHKRCLRTAFARSAFGVRRCPVAFEAAFLNRTRCFRALIGSLSCDARAGNPLAARAQASTFGKRCLFVTAGTYLKAHHFRTPQRLDVLQRGLLTVARDFSWELETWAVFSNHYHFIAHSRSDLKDANRLSQMLGILHTRTAGWINRLDKTPGRKVWHNFWDTRLTHQRSYLARLNYVHQNAVKHGLVP